MSRVRQFPTITQLDISYETGHIVWRTSTPEPVIGDGIIWTYLKDVTRFIPLFSKPGTFILQLDNSITTELDGEYACDFYLLLRSCQEYSRILCSETRSDVLRIFITIPARTARRLNCSVDDSR